MKYCDQCGAALNGDGRFCGFCGAPVVDQMPPIAFCKRCGTKLKEAATFCHMCGCPAVVIHPQKSEKQQRIKGQRKKKWLIPAIISVALLIPALIFLLVGFNRADFNIEYSPRGVEKFLNVVCRNVEGGSARVIDPNYDGPAAGTCYTAEMEVKLNRMVAEKVQMRFYNQNDSDKVSIGKVIFSENGSENKFNCQKEFIIALEKTLCGKSYAQDYISSRSEIERKALSMGHFEPEIIAEYWLTDALKVQIKCERSFSWDWNLYYTVTKIK